MEIQDTSSSSEQEGEAFRDRDVIARVVGDFGRWQLCITVLMSLLKLCNAWYQLNIIFMAPAQKFYCEKPPVFRFYSDDHWRKICKPLTEEEPCLIYDPDLLALNPYISGTEKYKIPLVPCKHFVYEKSVFNRTIVSDWDLVCDKRWMMHITQVIMMFGVLIGGIIFGMIADSGGRKHPLIWCIGIQAISSFVISAIHNYILFQVARFVLALVTGGITIISFVLCLEVVSGKWRTIMPVLYQAPFGLGNTVMAILAYQFRDWRKIEFGLASLSTLYLFYWFWIPESPRWLLAHGKTDEAVDVLYKAAKKNRCTNWTKERIKELIKPNEFASRTPPPFLTLLRYKSMKIKTVLLSINWLFTGIAFYTFSQYLGKIGNNIFVTVAATGLISVPGPIICVFFVLKFSRKTTIWIFQVVSGLCFVSIILIHTEHDVLRISFAGIGFSAMAAYVPTLYLYSGELYPTLGRNRGVAFVTMFARFGSMAGSLFVALDNIRPDLTLIVLTAMTCTQLLLLIPLPDTKDKPLLDTIEECEAVTK